MNYVTSFKVCGWSLSVLFSSRTYSKVCPCCVASVWAIVIVGVAALDDVRHQLSTLDALLYLSGLAVLISEFGTITVLTSYCCSED